MTPSAPATWLSVLLFLVLVAPGLLFDLGSSSRLVRAKESAFHEIARITLASLWFSGISVLFAVLANRWWPESFLNLDQAVRGGWGYIEENQAPAVASLVLIFLSSVIGAVLVNLVWTLLVHGWGRPWIRSKSAWSLVFKPKGVDPGTTVMATATLPDGTVVRGRVTEFSADLELEDRELILQPPIKIRKKGAGAVDKPHVRALVLRGSDISRLQVEYVLPEAPPERSVWSRARTRLTPFTLPAVVTLVAAFVGSLLGAVWGWLAGGIVLLMTRALTSSSRSRSPERTATENPGAPTAPGEGDTPSAIPPTNIG